MAQLPLLTIPEPPRRLETLVAQDRDRLIIPEGIDTIPCTHGMHRFPGKFIPNLPRHLLRTYFRDPSRTVLDPFCGSGTTMVECALEGMRFVGVDLDPLATMISRSKTIPLTEGEMAELKALPRGIDYSRPEPDSYPKVPNLSHWFTNEATAELSAIKSACRRLSPGSQRFALVVFSSIIRRASNADDQTQKTYVSHTNPKTPPLPSVLFPVFMDRALMGMLQYIDLLPMTPRGSIVTGDSTEDVRTLGFDDVLTSPPYVDSIDYIYNQSLEHFWLLDELGIGTYEGLQALRKRFMGFQAPVLEMDLDLGDGFERLCSEIGATSPKESRAVRSFFEQFDRHTTAVSGVQRPGSLYVCVIGDSYRGGRPIPTSDLAIDLFRRHGYRLKERYSYEIRRHYMKFPRRSNSGKIAQDNVLVLERGS